MKIIGVIPARYASTRFPGKPLAMIQGKSMIQRVYENASAAALHKVVVATDDERIYEHVLAFGGQVCMTAATHNSGTERCMEVVSQLEQEEEFYDLILNIQGDEPFLKHEQLESLISVFKTHADTEIASLMKKMSNPEELFDPNVVKVVCEEDKTALYFSRSPIPYCREFDQKQWHEKHAYYKHLGIYAFRTEILRKITALKASLLEKAESLEQLRWIENGCRIRMQITDIESVSVDTPEDIQKLLNKA